jgi:uncharacterized protein (TIGR02145 family)
MKRTIVFCTTLILSVILFAQAPDKLSYQAVIRNSGGELIRNGNVGIRIQILLGSEFGASVYVETHTATTNENGLAKIEIGGGTMVLGTFAGIDWSAGPYFLMTEADPAGATNYTITGTSQILSVPYALYAKTAENGFSGDYNDLVGTPVLSQVATSGSYNDLVDRPTLNYLTSEVDGSVTNEIQTLTLNSDQLTISPGGNTVTFTNWDTDYSDDVRNVGDIVIDGDKTFNNMIDAKNGLNSNKKNIINVADPVGPNDAATKAYVDNMMKELGLIPNNYSGTVTDIDGNTYKAVTIGTQVWMAENLRVGRYKNGTSIPLVTDNTAWSNLTTPGYCWYNDDEPAYKANYGALYNGFVVMTGNLCPSGWHVPTDQEWSTLVTYLGGSGGKLKETGTKHWESPNTEATNETGFTALPGGSRWWDGTFNSIGIEGNWWSARENYETGILGWRIDYNRGDIHYWINLNAKTGFSVRCLKD